MVLWINAHGVFNDVVLQCRRGKNESDRRGLLQKPDGGLEGCCCDADQTLDELLQLLLGLPHCLLGSYHSDELLVFVFGSGEDDPGASAVADLADVSATFSD